MTSPDIASLGIIGAGQMGQGIAQVAAQAGFLVRLCDALPGKAEAAIAAIDAQLQKLVVKARITDVERVATLACLTPAAALGDLATCDLVIEAATEAEALKLKILRELSDLLPAQAIIASNTSSISITRLAAASRHPERVLGLHFMNPVPLMPLIEVIDGVQTLPQVREAAVAFCARLGKTVVVSADSPGFIVNRVLLPMINEAVYALHEGVASADDIDAAMKLGAGQPMGPLRLADLIGLDTCLAILRVLHDELGDKYQPCPLLVRTVAAGRLGKKTGRGFFEY